MRICFINTPVAAESSDPVEFNDERIRRESCWPQLGILTIAAVTEKLGLATKIIDLNRGYFRYADEVGEGGIDGFAEESARQISAVDSDVYGFGTICSAFPLILRIAKLVKAIHPEATILLGGPQASVVAVPTLASFRFVDFILRGETEASLPKFLDELAGQRKFESVPGLSHRSIWGIQNNPDSPPIMDLDALPLPAYHLTGELRGADRASLEIGRGCPFACAFCSTNDFFRRKFRLRSPKRVLEDMCTIEEEYGIRDFDLTHDMFTVDARRVHAFCDHLIESGLSYTWSCSARTDSVDEELIEKMAAAGCVGMFFGVETGSERMQRIIDKHLDVERAHKVIDIVERAGIRSTISLITGFPEETWEDLEKTIRVFMHSARTPKSGPQLNLLAPLANTPIHLKHKQEMTLDSLCSDVSHQSRRQHPEDLRLIRAYPDIFPNFYLLPTPSLDRNLILELREFALMATCRFRWLLGALDQVTTGILDLFLEWSERRRSLYPALAGPDLRHYYRTPSFSLDFITFLRGHPSANNSKLRVFLDFHFLLLVSSSPETQVSDGMLLTEEDSLEVTDIAVRKDSSRVVEIKFDLQQAIDAVQYCRELDVEQGMFFYVVPQVSNMENPIYHVSPRVAKVLESCDGRRTVGQILEHLATVISVSPESLRETVFTSLLELVRSEELVVIYRKASVAVDSHLGARIIPEYIEINAAASLQNQSSDQLQ